MKVAAEISLAAEHSGMMMKLILNKARDVTVAISESGNIDGIKMWCDNAKAKISGGGDIEVDAAKSIDASVSDSGNVYYKEDVDKF